MKQDFERLVRAAEKRVKEMDEIDGFQDRELKTIFIALENGLKSPDFEFQYDAYVMLRDLCQKEQESTVALKN